jgi:hypothetical protein
MTAWTRLTCAASLLAGLAAGAAQASPTFYDLVDWRTAHPDAVAIDFEGIAPAGGTAPAGTLTRGGVTISGGSFVMDAAFPQQRLGLAPASGDALLSAAGGGLAIRFAEAVGFAVEYATRLPGGLAQEAALIVEVGGRDFGGGNMPSSHLGAPAFFGFADISVFFSGFRLEAMAPNEVVAITRLWLLPLPAADQGVTTPPVPVAGPIFLVPPGKGEGIGVVSPVDRILPLGELVLTLASSGAVAVPVPGAAALFALALGALGLLRARQPGAAA